MFIEYVVFTIYLNHETVSSCRIIEPYGLLLFYSMSFFCGGWSGLPVATHTINLNAGCLMNDFCGFKPIRFELNSSI